MIQPDEVEGNQCRSCSLVHVGADFLEPQFAGFSGDVIIVVCYIEEVDLQVEVDLRLPPHFEDLSARSEDHFHLEEQLVRLEEDEQGAYRQAEHAYSHQHENICVPEKRNKRDTN